MRKVVDDFRVDVKGQINRLEGGAKDDLRRKHASLLAFDYEAAARLKAGIAWIRSSRRVGSTIIFRHLSKTRF